MTSFIESGSISKPASMALAPPINPARPPAIPPTTPPTGPPIIAPPVAPSSAPATIVGVAPMPIAAEPPALLRKERVLLISLSESVETSLRYGLELGLANPFK